MKNCITLFAAMAVMAFTTFESKAQLSVGVKGGANFSTLSGDLADGTDRAWRTGAVFGLVAQYAFSDNFALQPEVNYSMQGGGVKFEIMDEEFENIYKLSYLNIPVLAKVGFGGEEFKFFLDAGPYFGYWLSGKTDFYNPLTGESEESDIEFEDEDELNRADFGLAAGLGVQFSAGPGSLFIEGRYNHGFVSIGDDFDGGENRRISAAIGYLFHLD